MLLSIQYPPHPPQPSNYPPPPPPRTCGFEEPESEKRGTEKGERGLVLLGSLAFAALSLSPAHTTSHTTARHAPSTPGAATAMGVMQRAAEVKK